MVALGGVWGRKREVGGKSSSSLGGVTRPRPTSRIPRPSALSAISAVRWRSDGWDSPPRALEGSPNYQTARARWPGRGICDGDGGGGGDGAVAGAGGVGGAAAGAGGVRGVAGRAPRGALHGRGLPRLLRRGGVRGRRGLPVRARHLPLLPAPRLPAPPQLAPPPRLGQAPLLRRRFASRGVHRRRSRAAGRPGEGADLVRGGLAVQPIHLHHRHQRELRARRLRRHALDPHLLDQGCRVLQAAFWYGLIVHFRIYPIIYAIPFVIVLGKNYAGPAGRPVLTQWSSKQQLRSDKASKNVEEPTSLLVTLWNFFSSLITRDTILFGLFSGSMFFAWTGIFFYLYGWEFLNEALLYHLTRTDPRHNFSIYFYHIYLHHQQGFSSIQRLASFLPQLIVQLALIVRFSRDLPFCMFLQTVAFVAFNKVMTAQYFVWFFCLLPLILPWTGMKLRWKGLVCALVWMGSQLHWLMWAYLLEFKGRNVFVQLWAAGLVFLAANTFVMIMVIRHHRHTPLFSAPARPGTKIAAKKE